MVRDDRHEVAARRSLALHAVVAERILTDPALLDRARRIVRSWLENGTVGRRWAEAWQRVLEGRPESIAGVLRDPGPEATELRQSSPFAGVLDPRTRWQVWRSASPER